MNSTENENCRLCGQETIPFYGNVFFQCSNCKGISKKTSLLPDLDKEKKRYDHHQNSPSDGYAEFVSPLLNHLLNSFTNKNIGLDFGCGPDSVISKILTEKKYIIKKFDPFYENHPEILEENYDFVIVIEVVEHFHQPFLEFKKLKNLLNVNGELLIMTHLFDTSINFEKWYYKNDFTHVFFYTHETFDWIKKQYNFSELEINGRFIRLRN